MKKELVESFNRLSELINRVNMPPTLGYQITAMLSQHADLINKIEEKENGNKTNK